MKTFSRALQHGHFNVVHYAGHAGKQSLHFDEDTAPGYAQGLVAALRARPSIDLVFLNGCATFEMATRLTRPDALTRAVPVVIATTAKVDDELAYHFALEFYEQLAMGLSIERAFREAEIFAYAKVDWTVGERRSRDGRHVVAYVKPKPETTHWEVFTSYEHAKEEVFFQSARSLSHDDLVSFDLADSDASPSLPNADTDAGAKRKADAEAKRVADAEAAWEREARQQLGADEDADEGMKDDAIAPEPFEGFLRTFREVVGAKRLRPSGAMLHVVFGNIAEIRKMAIVIPVGQAFDFLQRGPNSVLGVARRHQGGRPRLLR